MPDDGGRLLDRRWVLRVALVLVALPFLLTFAKVATADDAPRNHDVALIELRSGDVLGGDLPLVGSYERYGGNQPGPWLFWLLALPAAAGPLGIAAAVLLVGYGAVAGMLAVAARRGGALLVCWTALLSMVLVLGRGLDRLADPWEPMLTVLLVALAVMAVWEVASGTVSILPGVVALLWFLASVWTLLTSVAVAVGVVLVVAVAVVARDVVRSGDSGRRRALLIAVGASVAVLVVMVTPTIVEQVVTTPGNLTQLLDAAGTSEPTVGLSGAWSALRLQFDPWAPWLGRTLPVDLSSEIDGSAAGVVPVALLVWVASMVALAVAGRRSRSARDPDAEPVDGAPDADDADDADGADRRDLGAPWWLHAGTAAVLVGLLVGLSFSRGAVAVWSMAPTSALAMLIWLAAGWTALGLLLAGRPVRWRARATAAVAALAVCAVVATSVGAVLSDQEPGLLPVAVGRLAARVPSVVDPDRGPLLVSSDATANVVFASEGFGVAELVASLDRLGYRSVVAADMASKFGDRRARPQDATGELRVESGEAAPTGDGWELVGRVDPLTASQRRERARMDRRVAAASGGLEGPALMRRASTDPALADLLRSSAEVPDQPILSLWYRPTTS